MSFSHSWNGPYVLTIVVLLHLHHCNGKLSRTPTSEDHSASFDYVRPESSPFPSFKLKNSADALAPGRRGERKGSLHDVDIVAPPLLKKTKKAKDILTKAAAAPHIGYLETNHMLGSARVGSGKPGPARSQSSPARTSPDTKAKKPETESQRAERINKQFEKLMQFTALLGHVDSFLYDRTRSVVRTLHHMMGDNELASDIESNELRRRRHSSDSIRENPNERRTFPNEVRVTPGYSEDYYEPRYSGEDPVGRGVVEK